MKVFLHMFIGTILRVFFYYSPLKHTIIQQLSFVMAPYSYQKLEENYFYYYFKSPTNQTFQSEQIFFVYNNI